MENLDKALDSLIDELFVDEGVQKSMIKDENPAKETADEAVKQAPKSEKDEARGAGRPKQISEIPQSDTDGDRAGKYDDKVTEKESDADAKKKEDDQVEVPQLMKKAEKTISEEEWEEFKALKKAKKKEKKEEELQKAQSIQVDLIKSAVMDATSQFRKENEELRKAFTEQNELIKAMANKPQKSKAITNVAALEKFQKSESGSMSKADVLDIAEDLVKSKKLTMETVIELENTGFIYDEESRGVLEREIKRRNG